MAEIISKADLDRMAREPCPDCGKTHNGEIYFNSKCHPKAAVFVSYYNGMLKVECAECRQRIVAIKV